MTGRVQGFFDAGRVRSFVKSMGPYVSAVYLAQAVSAARSFINARCLGPEDYGFWGWLAFIVTFGYHLHLGVQEMLIKNIPALLAGGRGAEARHLARISFSFFVVMLGAAAGFLCLIAWALPSSTSATYRWGWVVVGFAMIGEVLFCFEQAVLRSLGRLEKLGAVLVWTSSISLALTCWLVITFKLAGLYVVAVLTPFVGFFLLHRHTGYSLKFVWEGGVLKDMVRRGFPVVAMGLCFIAINWVDRSVIMSFLGVKAHGYYTLGATLSFLVFLFPKGLAEVLEPKLHFHHAEVSAEASVRRHFLAPLLAFAWLMPLALLAGHMILPWVLRWVLPDYLPGLLVIRVLVWTSFFVGLMTLAKSSLVALGLQQRSLPAYLSAFVINILVSAWMVGHGYGAAGISLGSACAFGLVAVWLVALVMAGLKQSRAATLLYAGEIFLPYILLGLPSLAYAWLSRTCACAWLLVLPVTGFLVYAGLGMYLLSRRSGKGGTP